MPSHHRSGSPEYHKKYKKKSHHPHTDSSPEYERKRKHKSKRSTDDHREERTDSRNQRDDEHSPERRRIKREPRDEGYERALNQGRDDRHTRDRVRVKQERDTDWRDQQRERRKQDGRRREHRGRQRGNPFRSEPEGEFGRAGGSEEPDNEDAATDKEKPNFELSGKLTEDTNTFRGVVVKYNEPAEARKPKRKWRLYPFKGEEALPVLHIHRQSAYLLGRDRRVADIPIDHPSCSKQHAALQYRSIEYHRDDGSIGRRVRLYVIDLGSANGTYVNNNRIESERYVELIEKDVVKFGFSSREYVLLPDNADTSELCDEGDSSS